MGRSMNYQEAYEKLQRYGQEHVLQYFKELSETKQQNLLAQIEATDFGVIAAYQHKDGEGKKGTITPLSAMQIPEMEANRERFWQTGIQAVKEGRVGAVLLAGGMGTRLGSEEPKGMYNIGIHKTVYIFERIISNLMDVVKQADAWVHLFIMTSEKNHETTMDFFKKHEYFGYHKDYISFFIQDMAPATDFNGRVLMEEKGRMCTSPNGNGGWYVSMKNAGLLDIVHRSGIEWLNVFAVDNVLQRIADPCFIGAVIDRGFVSGAKVVRKNAPDERVGVMCLEDGKPSIIEYYELTEKLMEAKDENGDPAYNFGTILNYVFREKDLKEIIENEMPLHVAAKKIPYMDELGNWIKPEEPNGYKYETLVLDMVHQVKNCLPCEVVRSKEFAPVKNKEGIDSVETARALLLENGIEL